MDTVIGKVGKRCLGSHRLLVSNTCSVTVYRKLLLSTFTNVRFFYTEEGQEISIANYWKGEML